MATAASTDQFTELRAELFPRFVELSGAISTLVPLPKDSIAEMVERVFVELARQFEVDEYLLPRFDGSVSEARFCLETLHRAHLLAQDVLEGLSAGTLSQESSEAYAAAISQEWWSILHLRCLTFAIRHKVMPTDAVFLCIMKGFRHSVMAYTSARRAIEPRYKADYETIDFSSLTPHQGDYTPHDNVVEV